MAPQFQFQWLSGQTLFLGILGILLGTGMIVFAWRGKRKGDNPYCKRCRYDLTGLEDLNERCPECGNVLTDPRSVVHGQRDVQKGMLLFGLAIALSCIGQLGYATYRACEDVQWIRYKPMLFLLPAAKAECGLMQAPDTEELLRRVLYTDLSPSRLQQIIGAWIQIQAANPQLTDAYWQQILLELLKHKIVTPQQLKTIVDQGFNVTFTVKPVLRRDRHVILRTDQALKTLDYRIGFTNGSVHSQLLLNGQPYRMLENKTEAAGAKRGGVNFGSSYGQQFSGSVVKAIPDGPAVLSYELSQTFHMIEPVEYEPFEIHRRIDVPVTIAGHDAVVDQFTNDVAMADAMVKAWAKTRVNTEDGSTQVWLLIDTLPVGLSMGVWVQDGKERLRISQTCIKAFQSARWYHFQRDSVQDWSDKVSVMLLPDQEAADTQSTMDTYWGLKMQQDGISINAPYKPPFNMDQSLAPQMQKAVTIVRMRRTQPDEVEFSINCHGAPVRVEYVPTFGADGKELVDRNTMTIEVTGSTTCSFGYMKKIIPQTTHLTVRLEPNMQWEEHGNLNSLPWGFPIVFENMVIPPLGVMSQIPYAGKVILPVDQSAKPDMN
jgi:hypothetical protein